MRKPVSCDFRLNGDGQQLQNDGRDDGEDLPMLTKQHSMKSHA